nr:hypothetical protein HK105_006772 [Polyrhizophydium stewartii]
MQPLAHTPRRLLNTDGSLLSFQGVTPQRARTVATVVSNAWYAYDRHARPPPAAGVGLVLGGTPAAVDSGGEAEGQSELVIECEVRLLPSKRRLRMQARFRAVPS